MPRIHEHARPNRVPELRKGDTVVVLSGRDAGKQGTIERVIRRTSSRGALRSQYRRGTPNAGVSVVVSGVNIAKRHTKAPPPKQGRTDRAPKIQQGGCQPRRSCSSAPSAISPRGSAIPSSKTVGASASAGTAARPWR